MHSIRTRPQSASSPKSKRKSLPVATLFRRISSPPPYTLTEQHVAQPGIDSGATMRVNPQVHHPSFSPTVPSDSVHHQYRLKSHGRDYALITVASHAPNVRDSPLLYFGEELKGFVALSLNDLSVMQSVDVVLQMFDLNPLVPSYEARRKMLSHQVDNSHISNDQFCWPFSIPSPTTSAPPSSVFSLAGSPLGHQSSNGQSTGSNQNFQLIVTICRRGCFKPNIAMRQKVHFVHPSDPTTRSSLTPVSVSLPQTAQDPPAITPWEEQPFPPVLLRGVIFRQVPVEVECKLVTPISYPIGDIIPLRLTLTSENRGALDLLAVSHVIDVKLHKVMAFGEQAATVRPLSLRNRTSYHRSDLAAKAFWQRDGHTLELPPDDEHPRSRWRVKLDGNLHRETTVELTPSFEGPGMTHMYSVSLFPFRSTDFQPATDPRRALVMGKIRLTAPNHPHS